MPLVVNRLHTTALHGFAFVIEYSDPDPRLLFYIGSDRRPMDPGFCSATIAIGNRCEIIGACVNQEKATLA